ncbi:MAG: hypothetical protein JST60_09690 [Chloroflexi bacterium SZAS-1]|jgi:hypothetical protein|nr:hypothetical protein [Chloroflexi bacterium SZAS-1]HNP88222.1 hypothetical protein [Kouleothrix sp.]
MRLSTQPSEPRTPGIVAVPHMHDALRLMLAQGWQIDPPVLARLAWARHPTTMLSYHIILRRAAQRTLLVLTPSVELQAILSALHIPIV